MSSLLMLLSLLLTSSVAASSSQSFPVSVGSRSILRAIVNNNGGDRPDFAVDLNSTIFDAVLRETPVTYAVVEFFAHWFPVSAPMHFLVHHLISDAKEGVCGFAWASDGEAGVDVGDGQLVRFGWILVWCPACRNYKPHYEKVARLFNGADAVHPGIILMTRVDCALKALLAFQVCIDDEWVTMFLATDLGYQTDHIAARLEEEGGH
ncbi:hypothetical protein RJ640_022620 [Escallonia rubra]|uniref:Thioredoxin domain-containing protein n=1 Tax=Escallonia rubra TaxID=112253 RepID=A0AA88R680_9ASTE|nr:hypothetical protein RJ640_022620 [Escallonia rubra]